MSRGPMRSGQWLTVAIVIAMLLQVIGALLTGIAGKWLSDHFVLWVLSLSIATVCKLAGFAAIFWWLREFVLILNVLLDKELRKAKGPLWRERLWHVGNAVLLCILSWLMGNT